MAEENHTPVPEMVERVARILCQQTVLRNFPTATADQIAFHFDLAPAACRENARAAIEAMREPTEAMIDAIWNSLGDESASSARDTYQAAIDAALGKDDA